MIKRKGDKLYVKWKGYDSSFNSWNDKKDLVGFPRINMSQYFPKPYEEFSGDINVKVDLSNYATKADFKSILHVDTSGFALKTNLANLKTEIDKLDIHKNDIIKKTGYNTKITELENKISDISNLATKSALNADENKIADTSGLVEKTDYNAKITD